MKALAAGSLLALAAAAARGEDPGAAWPTYHGGVDLRGVTAQALPLRPVLRWRHRAGTALVGGVVSDGRSIFAVTQRGEVFCLGLEGQQRWQRRLTRDMSRDEQEPAAVDAPPVVVEDAVVVGTRDGAVYALDAATGAVRWRRALDTVIRSAPSWVRVDGKAVVLVVSQPDGVVHGLRSADGEALWTSGETDRCDGPPSAANGRVVFGSCGSALHVVDAATGRPGQGVELGEGSEVAGGVALSGNLAFSGTRSGELVCVDLAGGKTVWKNADAESEVFTTPAVGAVAVVYASDDGVIRAVAREDGKALWQFDTEGTPVSPVIAGDKVLAAADGTLYMLALRDGAKLWETDVADEIGPPAVVAGLVIVGGDDGVVSAFGAAGPSPEQGEAKP